MATHSGGKFEQVLFTGLIWAYMGIIFGAVFIGLVRFFELLSWPVQAEIPAAALSGAIGAFFYGSMQLTIFAAMAGALASFGFLTLGPTPVHPLQIFLTSGLAGLIVGTAYGLGFKASRVFRAEAKILAGLCGGMTGAALLVVLFEITGPLPIWVTTAILCCATGLIYAFVAPVLISHLHDLLPPAADGALVGTGVAVFVGLAIWVVVGDLHSQYTGPYTEFARHVLDRVPQAAGGAALGGALAGAATALFGKGLQEL